MATWLEKAGTAVLNTGLGIVSSLFGGNTSNNNSSTMTMTAEQKKAQEMQSRLQAIYNKAAAVGYCSALDVESLLMAYGYSGTVLKNALAQILSGWQSSGIKIDYVNSIVDAGDVEGFMAAVWVWIKKYWYIIAAGVLIIVLTMTKWGKQQMRKITKMFK